MKSTRSELKFLLMRFSNRFDMAEKIISELEDRSVEAIHSEEPREK